MTYFYKELVNAVQNTSNSGARSSFQYSYVAKEDDTTKPNYAKNAQGKTYAEWTTEWNRITASLDQSKAKQYLNNGSVAVAIDQADKTKADNYLKIYSEICTKGWKEDAEISDPAKLASKLDNLTYKVNGKVIDNMQEFQKVKSLQPWTS